MRTTIDRSGRLVVPKSLRERLHLADGGEVEVTERDGVIEIRVPKAPACVVETADGPVLSTPTAVDRLGVDDVRAVLDEIRR